MTTSYNGWSASPTLSIRTLRVGAVPFPPGVRDNDDVATVLGYVAARFDAKVERLYSPGCWGFNYRPSRNGAALSCHSSGTAIDCNAPSHPNGKIGTFSPGQRAQIIALLRDLGADTDGYGGVIHWGGLFRNTKDEMHFEVRSYEPDRLHDYAERIRTGALTIDGPAPQEDIMATADELRAIVREEIQSALSADTIGGDKLPDPTGAKRPWSVATMLWTVNNKLSQVLAKLDEPSES